MPRLNNINFAYNQHKLTAKVPEFPPIDEPSAEQIIPFHKGTLEPNPVEEQDVNFNEENGDRQLERTGGSPNNKMEVWIQTQDLKLNQLHNQLGNKWSQISHSFPGKSDNCVKNHFFSRLRMSLRHLNKQAATSKKVKPAKQHVIFKITSTCEERFNPNTQYTQEFIDFSYQLKNQIIFVLFMKEKPRIQEVESILQKIHRFNRKYKMRADILKNPKQSKRNKKQKEPVIAQDNAIIKDEPEAIVGQDLHDGETQDRIKNEGNELDTILRQSIYFSNLYGERISLKFIETQEYLFNTDYSQAQQSSIFEYL